VRRREGDQIGLSLAIRPFLSSGDNLDQMVDVDDAIYNYLSPKLVPTIINAPHHDMVSMSGYENTMEFQDSETVGNNTDHHMQDPENEMAGQNGTTGGLNSHVSPRYEKSEWFSRGADLSVLLEQAGKLSWLDDPGIAVSPNEPDLETFPAINSLPRTKK
jgi:hypothetical protein